MIFLYASFLWLLLPLVGYLFKREHAQSLAQNLRWLVLALLIVTLARPVLPKHLSTQKLYAHSVVIALDLSVSMNANDIQPTRAKASLQSIKKFLSLNRQEQIALIGFTSNPLLLSPPTSDHELLLVALSNINSDYILTKGTDLQKLFEKVAKFKDEAKKVILFTDGGDEVLEEELMDLVQREKIKILVIAMATQEGSSLQKSDGLLLENEKGEIVVSKLNGSLRDLAYASGGEFVAFSSVEQSVSSIEDWLDREKILNEALSKEHRDYFELGFVPLSLAILLFFLSSTRFSKKLLAFLLLLGLNVQAEELISKEHWGEGVAKVAMAEGSGSILDGYYLYEAYEYYEQNAFKKAQKALYKVEKRSLEAELLLAHIFYKEERYKEAKAILKGIKSSDRAVKQQLLYELGNCEAKLLYAKRAKAYYVQALQLGEDEDVWHNLKIVLTQLKEEGAKVGYTNPSSAQKSKTQSDNENVETKEVASVKSKGSSKGASGGTGSKKSKGSTIQVVKVETKSKPKRQLSSKAYDLINEGYIAEEKPW